MNQSVQAGITQCGRCNGSGCHTHGVCFGCDGLGIIRMKDYLPYKKNVDAVVRELGKAEFIIRAMLNEMTFEQKSKIAIDLESSGVADDGITRYHERRAALAAFNK